MAELVGMRREPTPVGTSGADALVARAARGDRDALGQLLRTHGAAIHGLAWHVCGPAEALDAAQEALERIVRSVDRYDPARGDFRTWALAVARNVCRDRLRRRGLERAAFLDGGDEAAAQAPASLPDPERLAVVRADARALEQALATLPEGQRAAVLLFHVHEASYEQIAQTLGVPIGTVMTWIFRGRKRLRAAMEAPAEAETADGPQSRRMTP